MPKHDIGELITALNDAVNKLNNLRTKYDDLEKENARLREALRAFPGFVDDATIGDVWIERKNAALGGEGNE
jgi:predicted nuclease with TOPRIM domain